MPFVRRVAPCMLSLKSTLGTRPPRVCGLGGLGGIGFGLFPFVLKLMIFFLQ